MTVVLITNGFRCDRCGDSYEMNMPCPIDVMLAAGKAFEKNHKTCPKRDLSSEAPKALDAWLKSHDTGLSSLALHAWFSRGKAPDPDDHPNDPSDFGRCYRMLKLAPPEWRARMATDPFTGTWLKLARAWDELERLFEEESPSGECPKMYARMLALRGARGGFTIRIGKARNP